MTKITKRRKGTCSCGDPTCKKGRPRPLSGLSRVDPISSKTHSSSSSINIEPVLSPAEEKILKGLNSEQQKRALKKLRAFSFEKLYSIALGLPSRVRRFVKHVWKREDKRGESWPKIATEMSVEAAKILDQRLDLVAFTSYALIREEDTIEDGRVDRMTAAKTECDALMCLYSHYLVVGVSAQLAVKCTKFSGEEAAFFLGGLADVVDYGRITSGERRNMQLAAEKIIKKEGWKLPERDHQK